MTRSPRVLSRSEALSPPPGAFSVWDMGVVVDDGMGDASVQIVYGNTSKANIGKEDNIMDRSYVPKIELLGLAGFEWLLLLLLTKICDCAGRHITIYMMIDRESSDVLGTVRPKHNPKVPQSLLHNSNALSSFSQPAIFN